MLQIIGRVYAEFKKFAEAGISVFLYDAHSFGRSEPKDAKLRSLVLDFRHLVDDVYTFREVQRFALSLLEATEHLVLDSVWEHDCFWRSKLWTKPSPVLQCQCSCLGCPWVA